MSGDGSTALQLHPWATHGNLLGSGGSERECCLWHFSVSPGFNSKDFQVLMFHPGVALSPSVNEDNCAAFLCSALALSVPNVIYYYAK